MTEDKDSYIIQIWHIELFSCSTVYKRNKAKEARMTPFGFNYSSKLAFLFATVFTSQRIVNFNDFDS